MKGGLKMKKRAQSEIITTVLLVIVALAAVAIIAVFIKDMITQKTTEARSAAKCIGVDFEITKAVAGTTKVIVQRKDNSDAVTGATLKVLVNGLTWNASAAVPKALETVSITGATNLTLGQSVEVGVILADGTPCKLGSPKEITAA
jgi:flagellin-like protein